MKYIFIDIDGTLTDRYGRVPLSAIKAIKYARKMGHKVFLATGRSKCEIFENVLDIGFDGIVGAAGGYVEVEGKVIESNSMTKEEAERIINILNSRNIKFSAETDESVYNNGKTQEFLKDVFTSLGRDTETDLFYNMMTKTENFDNVYGINKILYYDTDLLIDDMKKLTGEKYNIIPYTVEEFGRNSGEINIKGVTKEKGIVKILEYYGGSREETAAIGDGDNDIEMLKFANIGIAMGNSSKNLIKWADYVTDDVNKNGLSSAVYYILGEKLKNQW